MSLIEHAPISHSRAKWLILCGVAGAVLLGAALCLTKSGRQEPGNNIALETGEAPASLAQIGENQGISPQQLVGRWTPDGSCVSENSYVFNADGSTVDGEEVGKWRLQGDQLTLSDGDSKTSATVSATGGGRLSLRYQDGAITKLRHCSPSQVSADQKKLDADLAASAEADNASAKPLEDKADQNVFGKRAKCKLTVQGKTYINGSCWVRLEDGGSFQIMALDQSYFAQLDRDEDGDSGYWNEDAGSSHAQTRLGAMSRRGACWSNPSAEICAWQ